MLTNYWLEKTKVFQRFPTLKGEITVDAVIVGGGICGLLTAWQLQQNGKKVVILEQNHLATGATGASTGFITRPIDTSYAETLERYGEERLAAYISGMKQAQEDLITLITQERIDCDLKPATSHYISYQKNDPTLTAEWDVIHRFDPDTERKSPDQPWYRDEITFVKEAQLDLRALTLALAQKIVKNAGQIFENTQATDIVKSKSGWTVSTGTGQVTTPIVVITTGAIDSQLFPELSQLTHEIVSHVAVFKTGRLPFDADQYWDTSDPYFFFRSLGKNLLMVGGLDHEPSVKVTDPTRQLAQYVKHILPGKLQLMHEWSGSLFHTPDTLPLVFEHPKNQGMYFATGFAGVGIVPSMLAATQITRATQGTANLLHEFLHPLRFGVQLEKSRLPRLGRKSDPQGYVPAIKIDKLQEGKPTCVAIAGREILIAKVEDRYFAVDNACTHAHGRLCDGELNGTSIECPLHQSTFDLATGTATRPPATRALTTYPTQLKGNTLMVQIKPGGTDIKTENTENEGGAPAPEEPKRYLKLIAGIASAATLFWLVQFLYQYYVLIPGELTGSLVRSFALSGATLIGGALLLSIVFRFFPALADHWRVRRYMGVSGFTLILCHVLSVVHFMFGWDIAALYWSFDPFMNPIVFGSIGFDLFLIMAITSSDRVVEWLSYPRWKLLHRVAYFAWLAAVMHFIFINPPLLMQPFGYLLLTVTTLVLIGQLYWWIKIAGRKRFMTWGGLVGIIIISLYIALGYTGYQLRFAPQKTSDETASLEQSVADMMTFMSENANTPLTREFPRPEEEMLSSQEIIKSGTFENLNYMTSGSAQITQKDGRAYLIFGADFVTPDGPDLRVYLTKNTEPTKRSDIYFGHELSPLKNLDGIQMYELPGTLNLNEYHSVTIHCKAFNVPWSWARLQ